MPTMFKGSIMTGVIADDDLFHSTTKIERYPIQRLQ
jgi:hypothetical protein